MRAADKERSALPACRGGGGRSRARVARRSRSAPPRTPRQRGAHHGSGALPGYRGARRRGGRIRAPACACRPQRANRAHRARCGAGDARARWQRDTTCLQRVLAGRCGHVRGPSAARTAHGRALGWDGAGAYSRRQQRVKCYHRAVARWWSRSSPLERGGHVHVPPAKHEARAPDTRAEARAAQQWHVRSACAPS